MARWPEPSSATLRVPGVRYSTRPLLVGAPVSWYQVAEFTPEPAAPLNSSDQSTRAPEHPVEVPAAQPVVPPPPESGTGWQATRVAASTEPAQRLASVVRARR